MNAPPDDIIVRLEGVPKVYRQDSIAVNALQDIDPDIQRGGHIDDS